MKQSIITLGLVCLLLVAASAQEVQVPFDLEGKIAYLDRDLEQKLEIFPEYETFQFARIFSLTDSTFVLEIYYLPKEILMKNRIPLSAATLDEFRTRVTEKLNAQKGPVLLDQEGRTKFLVGTLSLALGYYGWAVPAALSVDDGKLAVALYMLTSGAGFYIPYSATLKAPVTDAAATLGLNGATRGILHGWMLTTLLAENPSGEGVIAMGMLTSIAEGAWAFKWATSSRMTAGTAEAIGTCGDFGIGLGFGTAYLADFFDDEQGRAISGSVLLGSGIGLLGGKYLTDRQNFTRGDALVLSATGLLGLYMPLGLVDMIKPDNKKAYTTAAIIGGLAGLGLGNRLVRGRDFSTAQGNYIRLSEISGGLLGLGLAYLISSDEDDNSTLYLTSSAIGATAGYWLMYRANASKALISRKGVSMNLQILPQALLFSRVSGQQKPVPFLDLRFYF